MVTFGCTRNDKEKEAGRGDWRWEKRSNGPGER